MDDDKTTQAENEALCGRHEGTVRVVAALRKYRAAAKKMLDLRYEDGFIDGWTSANFQDEIEAIEQELEGEAEES